MPPSRSEVNTLATTSGAGKHFFFFRVYHPHCLGMQTLIPPEDSGGHYPDKKIKYENNWEYKCLRHFSSPTSKQTCILCEPSRALKALSSNSASEERRKSDVTPVCFQTSNLQDTNTCASTICTIITFMTVQIAHYYHTIEM